MIRFCKSRLSKLLVGMHVTLACLLPVGGIAEASDFWGTAAQAIGVYAAYLSSLKSMLGYGNDPAAQAASLRQDLERNGRDRNRLDVEVVDKVMRRLVDKGAYVLKVNSLPFVWAVNDNPAFNAACYPTNYISINRGLVRELNCDEDELAAVLAHEMAHGIEQHAAENYAHAIAQHLGISILSAASGTVDWSKVAGLVNYSIAKNVTLPTEQEADESAFYIMTSAGFNPGGSPAAMARMGYYLRYETTDIWEYDDPTQNPRDNMYNDHPDTRAREQKLAEMMTEYSCGHVTVKDRRDVYIDGKLFLSGDNTLDDHDNRLENAYYIAGGLAKAFHDNDTEAGWNFRKSPDGSDDLLTDEHAYKALREAVARKRAWTDLQEMVRTAYAKEAIIPYRAKVKADEAARLAALRQKMDEVLAADKKFVKRLRENSDVYSDLGWGEYALKEVARAFEAKNQDNLAECYGVRGRAKAVAGDFDGAMADCDKAVEMDASNPYNFLFRADAYHMQGNFEAALADVDKALKVGNKNWVAHRMKGDMLDELGDSAGAKESYSACYKITGKPKSIPMEYLVLIDASAAKRLKKEEAEREKEKEEAEKEKNADGKFFGFH